MLYRKIGETEIGQRVTKRAEKLSSEIQHAVAEIIREHHQPLYPDILLTVTDVDCSDDLRNANIFCSFLSKDEGRTEEFFQHIRKDVKKIRHELASKIIIKYMPRISFNRDKSLENAEKINRLLRDI